jgi:hypothetical protein
MADLSSPFANVTSLLGSSSAWKKYFPGLATGSQTTPSYKGSTPVKSGLPAFKGIDFATGKQVDLGAFAAPEWGVATTGSDFQEKPLSQPAYTTPASSISESDLEKTKKELTRWSDIQRQKDIATNLEMLGPLQNAVLQTAYKTRQWDLANRMAGEAYRQSLPESVAARGSSMQQQRQSAQAGEALMLGAVSDAAYKAAMTNIAGLQAGTGLGRG